MKGSEPAINIEVKGSEGSRAGPRSCWASGGKDVVNGRLDSFGQMG